MYKQLTLSLLSFLLVGVFAFGTQKETKQGKKEEVTTDIFKGLKFRNIGPSFTSGRISDFVVNPSNPSEFFVAVASGHIWKTTSNGQTFEPVFDNYGAYSIGCLAMDPSNPNVIWAGTGENNHQRALGYGDGVYKSLDGGKSWTNMGLKSSRHIGRILIHPSKPNVVYVAAEGSAWGKGGQRGLYKTIDGGKTWVKILSISENTGINNIEMDPRTPNILYATSEQRRRHVHTKIGGGPESAVYKSEDEGKTWRKIMKGLPNVHIGGMGIAISPQNPDVIYLIVEAAAEKGGFFKSTDRGESWEKMSDYHSSGQYYNEIYCDPVEYDKVYSMETFSKVTTDGGKTWKSLGAKGRHVDDHAIWINPNNNRHWMIGGDGGVYITYDDGKNYFHVSQLPVIQFYRVAVDNAEPFYNVYGGTQDNSSMGGPSRNINSFGVKNHEWKVTVFGDGFWSRVDPTDENIVYSEWQYGNVVRYDKKSGERISIKPQPRKKELTYKWNWNAPLIISPHNHKRLYICANKVFKSEDRGNSWEVISPDLTARIDRNTWKVMGKYWSSDAVAKDVSTSQFGTIVSFEESPLKEGLLYVGTDDGLIQFTEDASEEPSTWKKINSFTGVPPNTYISDILASKHDENVVFASFDNRKRDDFKPYILKSKDKGNTWTLITDGLPTNGTVHTLEQDHLNPNLLFAGTEFGIFFSYTGGNKWIQLKSGIPTIAVRDLAIQKKENDLVLATFGRGFYILDDYSPLREFSPKIKEQPAYMFPIKDALLYMQTGKVYGQGATYWAAKNPEFGATFTLYLGDVPKTQREIRQENDRKLFKAGDKIHQPTWKEQEKEKREIPPYLVFSISDEEDNIVRKIIKKPLKGINRFNWDLRYESPYPIEKLMKFDPFKDRKGGVFVLPGNYNVSVQMVSNERVTELIPSQKFRVKALNNTVMPAADRKKMVDYQRYMSEITRKVLGTIKFVKQLRANITLTKQTLLTTVGADNKLLNKTNEIEKNIEDIMFVIEGVQAKASWEEVPPQEMPLYTRLESAIYAQMNSTSGITETTKMSITIIEGQIEDLVEKIKLIKKDMDLLKKDLDGVGANWTPERIMY